MPVEGRRQMAEIDVTADPPLGPQPVNGGVHVDYQNPASSTLIKRSQEAARDVSDLSSWALSTLGFVPLA